MTKAEDWILLVEDDEKLSNLVADYLSSLLELEVKIEPRGDVAVGRIVEEQPSLVILDVLLPGKDGREVCKEVRSRYKGPILMLTALGDEADEVLGLEIGADDYMSKPAGPKLLAARVKSLLRRYDRQNRKQAHEERRISVGSLNIDALNREVELDGTRLNLTTSEFNLLWFLAEHAGQIISRDDICRELRGVEWDGIDRSVDLLVARLRKKLGDSGKRPDIVKSVRGSGYLLAVTA